jgi:carboxypeptidase Taq
MGEKYEALKERLASVSDIGNATAVLGWDQQTGMPAGGGEARARQLATLSRIRHELLTSDETGKLLEAAAAELADADFESDEASMVRVVQHDYEEATRLPAAFVAEWASETTLAHEVWVKARSEKDFSIFQPKLEKLVDMTLQMAEYLGYDEHPYDALLGQYERGMTTAQVSQIFSEHRVPLVKLIADIQAADPIDDSILHQPFDVEKQREFAMKMVQSFGFDMQRGAQAVAVHPFCTSFSINDVRITTRFYDNWLNPALFGMMHEAGHGMYEQGVSQALEGTLLASGTSLGVHESQSRMWENTVGRSKHFWSWALPQLQAVFPDQLGAVDLDTFYRAINTVKPSFIRVEADEATYNLHIILRFELETQILEGKLKVKDLPAAWNDLFTSMFGITPPDDAEGVLQDVHWSAGLMGYFPTYALGNLLSAQYYNQALKDHPTIEDEIAQGKFDTLLGWMNQNIHAHGRKFTGDELTRRVTGEGIQSGAYMAYLEKKFRDVYGLS